MHARQALRWLVVCLHTWVQHVAGEGRLVVWFELGVCICVCVHHCQYCSLLHRGCWFPLVGTVFVVERGAIQAAFHHVCMQGCQSLAFLADN